MSGTRKSLAHSRWECKYHVVFIPKSRRKAIYGEVRQMLGEIFHDLARQKECRIIEGHLLADQVQMGLEIPPKHAVARVRWPAPDEARRRIATSWGNTSGRVVMPCPRWDLSWRV